MLSDIKAYATREFRSRAGKIQRRRYWATHGSTRYLWEQMSLSAAVDYVLNAQGLKMACYPDDPGSKQPLTGRSRFRLSLGRDRLCLP